MKLTIGYLYPTVMSQYGDRGNVLTLVQRCRWRGVEATVEDLNLGDPVDSDRVDILLIGGGADSHQRLICKDLIEVKGPGIRDAVDQGVAGMAVCAGYQLLGDYYRTADGTDLPGLGVFDAHTVHHAAEVGVRLDTIPLAGSVRSVGDLIVSWGDKTLVGFENHGGRTYLHPGARPLGRVILGQGNNSTDGWEGCVQGNLIGTYLHGPLLPKNPHLVDHLISAAIRRRYGTDTVSSLDDKLEWQAHASAARHERRRGAAGARAASVGKSRHSAGGLAAFARPIGWPEPGLSSAPRRPPPVLVVCA